MPQSTETMSADAVGVQPLDRRGLQPVAVAEALGDEVHDVGPEHLERAPQDHRGGDAVHVVVPVDRDALAPRDGGRMRSTATAMSASRNGSWRWSSDGCRKRRAASGSSRPRRHSSAGDRTRPSASRAPRRRGRRAVVVAGVGSVPDAATSSGGREAGRRDRPSAIPLRRSRCRAVPCCGTSRSGCASRASASAPRTPRARAAAPRSRSAAAPAGRCARRRAARARSRPRCPAAAGRER